MSKNKIDWKTINFGEIMMEELGLYADTEGVVLEQETDGPLRINGKYMVFPSNEHVSLETTRNEILFDPLNNPSLAKNLFGYFVECITEDGTEQIDAFYTMPGIEEKEKGIMRVVHGDDIICETSDYYNDSVKYLDAIMRLNGSEDVNLKDFDSKKEKVSRRK